MNISYSYFLPGVQDVLQGGNGQLATARMDAWIQETGGPYLAVKDTGGQWCWQASVVRQHSDPTDGFLCRKLTKWIVAVSWWRRFCAWQFAMQVNLIFMSTRSKAWVQFNQSQSNCNHLELHWWRKTGTGMHSTSTISALTKPCIFPIVVTISGHTYIWTRVLHPVAFSWVFRLRASVWHGALGIVMLACFKANKSVKFSSSSRCREHGCIWPQLLINGPNKKTGWNIFSDS